MTGALIREARIDDVGAILSLVQALAEYEKEPDSAVATQDDFRAALFPEGRDPAAFCHVAEVDGEVVGIALWFLNFSTWTGTHGIWLEDLFVLPEHRGSGLGKRLLATLAGVCAERGYARLEWTVLDWNEPSIAFYRSIGAAPMDEWTTQRLTGDALRALARHTP